jgi:hypothetical protein
MSLAANAITYMLNLIKMTNEEILQVDFYDLCGIGALWMTDDDKIKYWREVIEGKNPAPLFNV